MDFLFYSVAAINGFDTSATTCAPGCSLNACSNYATAPDAGLHRRSSPARGAGAERARSAALARRSAAARRTAAVLRGTHAAPSARRRRRATRRATGDAPRRGRAGRRPPRRRRAGAPTTAAARRPPPGPARRRPRRPSAARPRPARCSTTCSGAASEAARLGLDRGQPRAHRRGDDARRDRRGLPRLQREQRPAVRADLPAQGEVPNAANLVGATTCASAARASAPSTRSSPAASTDGARHRAADAEARDDVKPLPVDSTVVIRPRSALGLKYVEITQGHDPTRGFEDGATIPLAQRHAAAGRDRRGPQHVRRADARGDPDEPRTSFGDALRGPRRRTSTWRSRRSTRCCSTSTPVMTQPGRPPHRARALRSGRWGGPPRERRARRRAAGGAVPQPGHDLRGARRASARTCRSRSSDGPPALEAGDQRASRASGPFLANIAGLFRDLRPGVARAAHRGARPGRRAHGRHADAAPVGRAQPAPRARRSARSSAFAEDPLVAARRSPT